MCLQSEAPLARLCGAVQDLCQCLMYLIKTDGLLTISMLDVAEKTTTSLKPVEKTRPPGGTRAPEEESTVAHIWRYEVLEQEVTGSLGELAIYSCHLHHLDLLGHGQRSLTHPLEDVDLLVHITPGGPAGPKLLRSIQVVISHKPMMG